ncbi:hypothetical protein KTO58_20205 [Chitinophaga pendula]|nr:MULTISPECIES: hypothetical protein [Chitinophaga]UCJ05989.1 hypothetical protein KTO58_20205 [Chitinophaga pendula]
MKKRTESKLNLGKIKVAKLSQSNQEVAFRPTYTGCSLKCTPPISLAGC